MNALALIAFFNDRVLVIRHNYISTGNLQLAQGTVFDESDNANLWVCSVQVKVYSQRLVRVCKREVKKNNATQKADSVVRMYHIILVVWNYFVFEKMSAEEDTISLKKEKCWVVLFLLLLKKTSTECCLIMCEAFRHQVVSCRQVFHWHKQFREGRILSVAVKQSGRSIVMINTIETLIADDNLLTQREIAAHLGMANGAI